MSTAKKAEDKKPYSDINQPAETKKLVSFTTAFLAAFNLLFFGPVDIYLSSITELTLPSKYIIIPAVSLMLIVTAGLFVLLYFLKGRAHIRMMNFTLGLTLALYIQGNFIKALSTLLDGRKFSVNILQAVINLLVWCLIVSVPFIVYKKLNRYYTKSFFFAAVMIGVMEISGLAANVAMIASADGTGILTNALLNEQTTYVHSQTEEFSYSSDHNLIVIISDEYDSYCFDSANEEYPEGREALKDFTYYRDTIGMYGSSVEAINHMFSGKYAEDSEYPEDVFEALTENGYDIELYVTNGDVFPTGISEKYASNYIENKTSFSEIADINICMMKLVGYKYSPELLKGLFYMSNEEISRYLTSSKSYYPDNLYFYNSIPEKGTLTDERQFKVYYTYGLHDPRSITRDLKRAENWSVSPEEQAVAVNRILSEFLNMLKETGAYDNSDIVILADHGIKSHENGRYPLLLVKRADVHHDEMEVSDLRVSYEQLFPTFAELAGGNSEEKTVFELTEEDNKTRYFAGADITVEGNIEK